MKTTMILDETDIKNAVRHYLQTAGHDVTAVRLSGTSEYDRSDRECGYSVSAFADIRINPPKVK